MIFSWWMIPFIIGWFAYALYDYWDNIHWLPLICILAMWIAFLNRPDPPPRDTRTDGCKVVEHNLSVTRGMPWTYKFSCPDGVVRYR